jgi:hypothetical protein
LGLVLEKFGMTNLDTSTAAFTIADGRSWSETSSEFAAFVKQNPPATKYSIYAEYLGDPQRGPTEVRWLIVDSAGALVLSDTQSPADADFRRTAGRDPDPMGCSVLVAERYFSLVPLKKSGSSGSEGKFARRWAEKSGTPGEAERREMASRSAKLRSSWKAASISIYPSRVNSESSADSAGRLVTLIGSELKGNASAAGATVDLSIAPTSNQQKRLWDLARGFREHLRKHAPETDYALIAEFLIAPEGKGAHSVHFVVCDKAGEFVIVDFQNNQHADFQRINPKTTEDCETLTIARLGGYLP